MMRDGKRLEPYIITGLAVLLLLFVASDRQARSRETNAERSEAQPESLRAVTPREALELVHRNKDNPNFVILDVRTPEEFESGHIEGAVNMDYYHPGFQVELGKLDRTRKYLVYCRTGNRSDTAFGFMKEAGFKEVHPLEGGILAWRAAGFPVAGEKRQ
jgi:rhodanese-related sulfurtransferase